MPHKKITLIQMCPGGYVNILPFAGGAGGINNIES